MRAQLPLIVPKSSFLFFPGVLDADRPADREPAAGDCHACVLEAPLHQARHVQGQQEVLKEPGQEQARLQALRGGKGEN